MRYLYLLFTLLLPGLVSAQEISGQVLDEQHQPLPAITVAVKGTGTIRFTDDKGQVSLPLSGTNATLRFTGVNIEPKEISWTGAKTFSVILRHSNSQLDEVQVIAYGTTTQRYTTGSVTKVTGAEISRQAVSNPLSALQGRVPGLVVTSTSGLPGASVQLQVRGQNTLRSGNAIVTPKDNPLLIIDGVPFAPQNGNINQFSSAVSPGFGGAFNNAYGGLSPFNSINPQDIESIEVLRDADATAIYGSRGGNGVILITTKKGKAGRTTFDLNAMSGVSFTGRTMPLMNTADYLNMRKEALANDGLTPSLTLYDPGYAPDLLLFDQNRYTDWKKQFTGDHASHTSVNASLSGGNAQTTFHLSGGYNRDSYIFPGDYADQRGSAAFSLHHGTADQRLSIDFSATYSSDRNNTSGARDLLRAYSLDPNYPALTDEAGKLNWSYQGVQFNNFTAGDNPLAYLRQRYQLGTDLLNGSLQAGYRIIKGLTLRSSFGYNTSNSSEYAGTPKSSLNPFNNPTATARFGTNDFRTWIIEPQLEYKGFAGRHSYSALVGGTFQQNDNTRTTMDGSGYINDGLIGSISGAPNTSASDDYSQYKYNAAFGRLTYRYDERYLLNVNIRRDGSSRFGPDKRFGTFGSVGAGWIFSEEELLRQGLPLLSYGKLRGSYGITGSDAVGDYQYLSRWAPTDFPYDGNLGYLPQNLFNARFGWATTKKLEIGLELGFLQNRVLLNATWYRNRSGNQLVNYLLPSQTGFSNVIENLDAVVQNTGLELALQATPLKTKDLSWTINMNLTVPRNKLLSFPGLAGSSYATTYFTGQPLSTVTGFRSAGVDPQTGLFRFYTANGEKTSTPAYPSGGQLNDFALLGNTDPKFYGGMQHSLSYKDLQLDLFVEFRKQTGLNYLAQIYSGLPGFEQNLPATFNQRWQQPGDNAAFQRLSASYGAAYDAGSAFFQSSGVYSDASYIRLKTLSLSWRLPLKIVTRLHIQNLRVYGTAQNLWTITGYKGNDPETQNFYGVPPLKTIAFGLQLTL